MKSTGQITASFSCQPGDEGERLLKRYVKGDTIIAYAKWHGAVGWGTIENPKSYRLIEKGSADDKLGGPPGIGVLLAKDLSKLEAVTRKLLEIEVMEGEQLRAMMGVPPPRSTSETIPLPTNELR